MRRSLYGSLLALAAGGATACLLSACDSADEASNCGFLNEPCGPVDGSTIDGSSAQDASTDATVGDGGLKDGSVPDGTLGDASTDGATGDSTTDGHARDAQPDTTPSCDSGLAWCGDAGCVALESIDHCGACSTSCSAGPGGTPECVAGDASYFCSATCSVAQDTYCGDDAGCVNLSSSMSSCGSCGHACTIPAHGASAACADAGCQFTCASGYHACLGNCDPNTDSPADAGTTDPCILTFDFGVFVSPAGSDTAVGGAVLGSPSSPYLTIRTALQAAKTAGKRLYACQGTYNQTVTIDSTTDGVTAYGGLNCSSGWVWTGVPSKVSSSAPTTPALSVNALATGVEFDDFAFTSPDAPQTPGAGAGQSSIAAIVNSGTGAVTFRRVTFQSGKGQPGAAGTNATTWSVTAANGNNADGSVGATALSCACGGTGGAGGYAGTATTLGGFHVVSASGDGQSGTPLGTADNGAGFGLDAGTNPTCTPGGKGIVGAAGDGGAGEPDATGILGVSGWTPPPPGSPGTGGATAQGGGGGGGYVYIATAAPAGGGGGGGCGGCGGSYGTGGFSGGASVSLAIISSSVLLDSCSTVSASGGSGGAGGNGAQGQPGGDGGLPDPPGNGCNGGPGGTGGSGGAGGGGAGGASIGVAYVGTAPTGSPSATVATAAAGGAPGAGAAAPNGQGASGIAASVRGF